MINQKLREFVGAMSLEGLAIPEAPPRGSAGITPDFSLEELTDLYRINGVQYRDGIYTLDLSKELLPSKTQDQHAEHRNQVIANNTSEFYTSDYAEFNAYITTLFQNKDNPQYKEQIEQARLFIKNQATNNWLMTLTRIQYNPKKKKDVIKHNYKQADQYSIELDSFIGSDGYITNQNITNVQEPLQALLDTRQSIQEIYQTYKWLADADAYIWRENSTPSKPVERVARFIAGSVWTGFDCSGNPGGSSSAFGVRVVRLKT